MNKTVRLVAATLAASLAAALSTPAKAQSPVSSTNSRGEQFYVISSVDVQKHQIVLMRPTQLTVVASTSDQTTYLGEQGQKLALKDLRAGQTVWATLRKEKNGQQSVLKIREGAMTVAELHRLFLDYPAK
jgi:type IV secretory pathway protease TraF